jgi:RimJ/RimL family protein N-acetyltransferase
MTQDAGATVEPVTLTAGPYLLDVARATDVEAVAAAFDDPEIALWNPGTRRPGATLRQRAALWIADRAAWTPEHTSWVVRSPDGVLLGQVSLHRIDREGGDAEIGYWLVPAARGAGVGTAAVAAATRYGFDVAGVARIELFHAVENEPSCRLATRCGYLLEGTSRQSFVYGDGRRHDEHNHARLATDPEPDLVVRD